MSKLTRQGIPDLNDLGNIDKGAKNGRKDKHWQNCFHVFEDLIDDNYLNYKRCAKCGYEDV